MSTQMNKFSNEQIEFLDLFWKVNEKELDEYDNNLYYTFMQKIGDADPDNFVNYIKSSYSYEYIPSSYQTSDNIYFGVNLAGTQPLKKRTTVDSIIRIAAFFAEFDGKDLVDVDSEEYKAMFETCYKEVVARRSVAGINTGKSAERGMRKTADTEARLAIFKANRQHYLDLLLPMIEEKTKELPPSVIVFSGGGYHCYWLLDKAKYLLTPENKQFCIKVQENLVTTLGADTNAKDIARVLRVVGTVNTRYDDNNVVRYEKQDTAIRYNIEQLAEFAHVAEASDASHTTGSSKAGGKASYMHNMPDPLEEKRKAEERKKFINIPPATKARLHELYSSPLEVFRHLGLFTSDDELEDEGDEWRIRGYGGLLVAKEGGAWRCHGEDYGGDIVYAWLWASDGLMLPRKEGDWSLNDNKLWAKTVRWMLKEKDVDLDYDYNIFLTDEDTAKTVKAFFDAPNPRDVFVDNYKDVCEKVTTYAVKKYSRNEEAKLKLGGEFPIYRLSEMKNYDIHKDEVIEQIAYRGLVSLLFAKPNTGKSYLAIEIATSLMLGKKLLEQLNTRSQSSCVLYIAAETDADFKNRTVRAALKFNASVGKIDNLLTYFDGDALKFRLDDLDWINRFAATYLHHLEAKDALPDLIIIDTLRTATNAGDFNENDNMQMSKLISNTKRLCKALGNAACILIHHTHRTRNKKQDADYAGAGSLEGDCHIVLFAKKTDDDTMQIYSRKNKLVKSDSSKSILGIKFASTGDGAVLEPFDKKDDASGATRSELNDTQERMLKVIYDECMAGTPPIYKTFANLLAKRYNTTVKVKWINQKKTLGIDPLAAGEYITFSGGLTEKTTVILITDKGKSYIESMKIREEDLVDDEDEDDD